VQALETGAEFLGITGVYTRESIQPWKTRRFEDKRFLAHLPVPPAYIEDIDSLPPPNRNHIRHIQYTSTVGITDSLATIISSRGCPYRCIYCDVPYKRYRERDIAKVVDEIEQCLSMGYKEIHFYDDLFNITPGKVIRFCEEISRRGLKFPWDFRGRVNTATRESLEQAKQAGCHMISFGIETGSDEGLQFLCKGTTTEQIRKVLGWCKELRIQTIADYMLGFPFEKSAEDVWRHVDFIIDLEPTYIQFCVLTLYPNTPVFDMAVQRGLIDGNRWNEFCRDPKPGFAVDHWNEFLSTKELVDIQRKAYKKFYIRPSYIWNSIKRLTSWYELKTKIRGALKMLR